MKKLAAALLIATTFACHHKGPQPVPFGSGITFVQANGGCAHPVVTSVSYPFSSPQTAGDFNIVAIGWNDNKANIASVTDTLGNAYSQANGVLRNSALSQTIYYAANIKSGRNTVTVKFSGAGANIPDLRILEYSGLTALDVNSGGTGTAVNAASSNATTTNANDLIFGAAMTVTGASAGSGFTSRLVTSPCADLAEDKIVSTTGSYNATATMTSVGNWIMQMAAFQSGAAPPQPQPPAPGNLNLGMGYGSVNVGSSAIKTITLINNGVGPVSITGVTYTDPAFTDTSPVFPLTVPSGSAISLQVTFTPSANKPYSANATVNSNASNGPAQTFMLSGTGIGGTAPPVSHSVSLTWTASTSTVSGYNVYRSGTTGGPYTKQNSSLITGLTWTDSSVTAGATYFYISTAVNSASNESAYSNEAKVTVPTP
jgi:hypothetical protein